MILWLLWHWLKKVLGKKEEPVKYYAEVKDWGTDKWVTRPPQKKPLPPSEIDYRLRKARRKPKPKPKGRFFKPRPVHEKRLWKPEAKPED